MPAVGAFLRTGSGRCDQFGKPSAEGRYLRTPAIQSGTKRLILTTSER
jgi:hypothetical protein